MFESPPPSLTFAFFCPNPDIVSIVLGFFGLGWLGGSPAFITVLALSLAM
jgi:hypothetical protein